MRHEGNTKKLQNMRMGTTDSEYKNNMEMRLSIEWMLSNRRCRLRELRQMEKGNR